MRQSDFKKIFSILAILLVSFACNITSHSSSAPLPILDQSTQFPSFETSLPVAGANITKTINAVLGGQIELLTPQGDQLILTIPPFALSQSTEITLTSLDSPPSNPISNSFFSGVAIHPDQLKLRLPATLALTTAKSPSGSVPMLFYIKEPDLVLPLAAQSHSGSGDTLSGRLLHFSTYTGGSPSSKEAASQANQAAESQPPGFGDWQSDFETIQALTEWSSTLQSQGMSDQAQQTFDQASQRLRKEIACLFDLECTVLPLDPCGDYQQQLIQYFEQANLLAFDPQVPLMTQLYDELQRVLNECTNRYTLEYNHSLFVNQSGLDQKIMVTGKVIFTAPIYGVFELGEPLKLQGNGSVDVEITGTMTTDAEACTLSGSGNNDVVISGEFEADEVGEPWLAITVTENWYTQGSMTVTCPNGVSQEIPLPGAGQHSYPLRFQYIDGAKSMAPNLGGMQGSYNWILHILHSW